MPPAGWTSERGLTLIELMIALVIGVLVLGGILVAVQTQTQTYAAQGQVVDMVQTAGVVSEILSRDLRMAGYSPVQGVTISGVTYDATGLQLQADLNGNGVTSDPGEAISYVYNGGTDSLVRSVAGVGQSVFPNVQTFAVSYFDWTGAPTTTSANIRQVQVNLTLRTALPDPAWPTNQGYRTLPLQVLVTPRNLGL